MKLKLYKKNGDWNSSIHRGNGGISSMVAGRTSKSIWFCLMLFSISNLWKAFTPRMFFFFGPKAKYSSFSWWANFMGGHLNIGKRITIFGTNAMCWVLQIYTRRWGTLCITLPSIARWRRRKRGWHFYIYLSPNSTPWASTFYIGGDKKEHIRAQIRKLNFGHGFDTCVNGQKLHCLNQKFESFLIHDFHVEAFLKHEAILDDI